jgi:hypothetical protein
MTTLIYKQTHCGDPDASYGVFGCRNCLGHVRGGVYDAVIGVGGVGHRSVNAGIARRLTWIGIGPHRTGDLRKPTVTFDHFWYKGPEGPMLKTVARALAKRLYERNVRVLKDSSLSSAEVADVKGILRLARRSPPSAAIGSGQRADSDKSPSLCRPC